MFLIAFGIQVMNTLWCFGLVSMYQWLLSCPYCYILLTCISQNCRQVEVGRSLWRSLGPTLAPAEPPELVPSMMSRWVWRFPRWSPQHLSGRPVPWLQHPSSTEILPDVQREPPGSSLCPWSLVLALGTTGKRLAPSFLLFPFTYLWTQMSSPSNLSLSTPKRSSSPFIIFVDIFTGLSPVFPGLSRTGEPRTGLSTPDNSHQSWSNGWTPLTCRWCST